MSTSVRVLGRGVRRAGRSAVGRKTLWFVVLSGMGSVLAAITTGLLAHLLSTDAFAAFTFSKSALALVAGIFEFGIFFPAARLAALATDDTDRRQWVGTTLLAYVPLAAGFAVVVAGFSFLAEPVFGIDAGTALLITSPLAIAYPFGIVATSLGQGTGKAYLQPLMAIFAGALIVVGVLLGSQFAGFGLTAVLAIRGVALLLGAVLVVILVRPLLGGIRRRWSILWAETRRWGMRAYAGRVISVGTFNVDVLIVAALTDSKELGAYGLAVPASNLILIPAIGLGTALFPKMVRHGRLDRRPLVLVVAWGLLATFAGVMLSIPVLERLNPDLAAATWLLIPLGLAATVRGVTSVLNAYLNARAAGKALQNTSIVLAVSNLLLTPLLVLAMGAMGAALATLGSMVINLLGYVYYTVKLPPEQPALATEDA